MTAFTAILREACPKCDHLEKPSREVLAARAAVLHKGKVELLPNDRCACVCEKLHEFTISYSSLLRGRWCRRCNSKKAPLTSGEVRSLVEGQGFVCVDQEYPGPSARMKIACGDGHPIEVFIRKRTQELHCEKCDAVKQREKLIAKIERRLSERQFRSLEALPCDLTPETVIKLLHRGLNHTFSSTVKTILGGKLVCKICFKKSRTRKGVRVRDQVPAFSTRES